MCELAAFIKSKEVPVAGYVYEQTLVCSISAIERFYVARLVDFVRVLRAWKAQRQSQAAGERVAQSPCSEAVGQLVILRGIVLKARALVAAAEAAGQAAPTTVAVQRNGESNKPQHKDMNTRAESQFRVDVKTSAAPELVPSAACATFSLLLGNDAKALRVVVRASKRIVAYVPYMQGASQAPWTPAFCLEALLMPLTGCNHALPAVAVGCSTQGGPSGIAGRWWQPAAPKPGAGVPGETLAAHAVLAALEPRRRGGCCRC
jgi:hypothetical protein